MNNRSALSRSKVAEGTSFWGSVVAFGRDVANSVATTLDSPPNTDTQMTPNDTNRVQFEDTFELISRIGENNEGGEGVRGTDERDSGNARREDNIDGERHRDIDGERQHNNDDGERQHNHDKDQHGNNDGEQQHNHDKGKEDRNKLPHPKQQHHNNQHKQTNDTRRASLPDVDPSELEEYIVEKGDTLNSLSLKFDMPVKQIKQLNQLFTPNLFKGQKIVVLKGSRRTDVELAFSRDPSAGANTSLATQAALSKDVYACFDSKRVFGELVVTDYCVMFEPSVTDPNVKQFGLMEYQCCIDTRDIHGCAAVTHLVAAADDDHHQRDNSLFDNGRVSSASIPSAALGASDQGTNNGNSDVHADPALPGKEKSYLQLVWCTSFLGYDSDLPLFFLVDKDVVEELVERIQEHLLQHNDSRQASPSPGASRPTLTSGNPLMHAARKFSSESPSKLIQDPKFFPDDDNPSMKRSVSHDGAFGEHKETGDREIVKSNSENAVSRMATTKSPPALFPPTIDPSSDIFGIEEALDLEGALPARCRGYNWKRIYSFNEDGVSLSTLYDRTQGCCECLTIIQTMANEVIGVFVPCELSPAHSGQFFGNGECFVFRLTPTFQAYRWTGNNDFFINCGLNHIGFGGGGSGFALSLDGDLFHGSSSASETFANTSPLTSTEFFDVANIEVYAFELKSHHDEYHALRSRRRSASISLLDKTSIE